MAGKLRSAPGIHKSRLGVFHWTELFTPCTFLFTRTYYCTLAGHATIIIHFDALEYTSRYALNLAQMHFSMWLHSGKATALSILSGISSRVIPNVIELPLPLPFLILIPSRRHALVKMRCTQTWTTGRLCTDTWQLMSSFVCLTSSTELCKECPFILYRSHLFLIETIANHHEWSSRIPPWWLMMIMRRQEVCAVCPIIGLGNPPTVLSSQSSL